MSSEQRPHPGCRRRWLFFILGLYFLLGLAYSVLVPPWEAPDETAHYLVVYHVAREGQMPTVQTTYEAVQPPSYYWLAAGVFRLLDAVDRDLIEATRPHLTPSSSYTRYGWTARNYRFLWGMQVLRWLNVVLAGLGLVFVYKGARHLFHAAAQATSAVAFSVPRGTVALVALTPQFLHNAAAVSNDALANAAGAFLFWLLIVIALGQLRGWAALPAIFLAVTLPFLIKLTLLPMSAAVLVTLLWRGWRRQRRSLLLALVLSLLVLAGALWWLAPASAVFLWRTFWWRITYVRPNIAQGWSLSQILSYYAAGYWGQIGWKMAALPAWLVGALWATSFLGVLQSLRLLFKDLNHRCLWRWLLALTALASAAIVVTRHLSAWWQLPLRLIPVAWFLVIFAGWRQRQGDPARRIALPAPAWRVIWLAASLAFLVLFRNALTTPQFQARFLFPSLGVLALLTVTGWATLLPRRVVNYLPQAIVVAFLILNVFFWADMVIPVFFQPFLDG